LAVRIPKALAEEVGLEEESSDEVSSAKGRLVVTPIATQRRVSLKQRVAQITEDNLHSEFHMGRPVENEVW
jgi:antitoxin MazE